MNVVRTSNYGWSKSISMARALQHVNRIFVDVYVYRVKRNRFHLNLLNAVISSEAAVNINSSWADKDPSTGESDDDEN